MEVTAGNSDGGEFCSSYLDACWAFGRIELSTNLKSFAGCGGCSDPVDDDLVTHQGLATPMEADQKAAMVNLIPLTCTRWEVAHPNRRSQFVGKPLGTSFPRLTGEPLLPP
jgi:hypothetical protein